VSAWGVLITMQISLFVLGMLMDDFAIVMLCVPIYVPVIKALGFDTLWFAMLFMVNMQMAYLTPPYGFNLFYMKSIVPPGITMGDIYRSIVPFVALQMVGLILVMIFPQLAVWLPRALR
jgi:TRAP-type mannitol/chloroaromatic compound transport system permease large subunit